MIDDNISEAKTTDCAQTVVISQEKNQKLTT